MQALTRILCSLLLISITAWADSAPTPDKAAHAALAAAIADMSSRLAHIDQAQPIRYSATYTDKDGRRHRQHHTVSLAAPVSDATPELGNASDSGPDVVWNPSVFAQPANFDIRSATLIDETDSRWVFRLPHAVTVGINTANAARDQDMAQGVNQQLQTSLVREIQVTKTSPRISSQRIFATQPFKPTFLARVDKFMLRIEYREAWPAGPWIHHVRTREVAGRYALLFTLDEFEETTHSGFTLLNSNSLRD